MAVPGIPRDMNSTPRRAPMQVLIAGGGVAGLETMMALHELAGPRVAITLLSRATEFVYQPLSVREPFGAGDVTRRPLDRIARDFGADLRQDTLTWVAPGQHAAFTHSGGETEYDVLVLALGARREQPWDGVITFRGSQDSEAVRGLVADVDAGRTKSVAFV